MGAMKNRTTLLHVLKVSNRAASYPQLISIKNKWEKGKSMIMGLTIKTQQDSETWGHVQHVCVWKTGKNQKRFGLDFCKVVIFC